MSAHTLSTYTVHVPVRQVPLRQKLAAYRQELRTRAELRSALGGDFGYAQHDEVVRVLGRRP